MADNWQRYQRQPNPAFPSPQIAYIPPVDVGIGHEDDQAFARFLLNRTDLPSCGYPVKVWTQGNDVFAELDGVPEAVASLCNGGQLREVSAEIYPNYRTPDGKYHGPVLRRISLLGANPPRQKGLGGIPRMVYSFAEVARSGRPAQQVRVIFSESPFMTKDQAIQILTAAGIDFSAFAADEPALIGFATYVQNQTGQAGTGQMAPMQQFAETINRQIAAATVPVLNQMREMASAFGQIQQNTLRQEIETFAETNKDKLFPFETDKASDKYVVTRLVKMSPDSRRLEMDSIANRPKVAQFAERMGDGGGTRNHGNGDTTVTPERVSQLLALTPGGQNLAKRIAAAKSN